jgi:hypothetical protein
VVAKAVRIGSAGVGSDLMLLTSQALSKLHNSTKISSAVKGNEARNKDLSLAGLRVDNKNLQDIRETMLSSARRKTEAENRLRVQEESSTDKLKNRWHGAKLTKTSFNPPTAIAPLARNFDIVLVGLDGVTKKIPRTSKMVKHFS